MRIGTWYYAICPDTDTSIPHFWWTNVEIVVLASGRNVGSPLAGVDVDPPLESVVGPKSCYLAGFQRWTHMFLLRLTNVGPLFTFATDEPTYVAAI